MRPRLVIRYLAESRSRHTIELLAMVWLLAIADLFFTIWAHLFTPFKELNPFAQFLLRHNHLASLAAAKLVLTAIGTAIFWLFRERRIARIGLWVTVLAYTVLLLRWSDYTVQVQALHPTTPMAAPARDGTAGGVLALPAVDASTKS